MKRRWVPMWALTAACVAWLLPGAAVLANTLPTAPEEHCEECREAEEEAGLFHGELVSISQERKSIQLQIGGDIEVLYFDGSTALKNASAVDEIPLGDSLKILYLKKGGKILAKEIEVRKSEKVRPEQLASLGEVAKLVSLGPDRGKYVLLDGRPVNWYSAGHIPTARAMPIWAFDELKEKLLPADKNILQIYYCSGFG